MKIRRSFERYPDAEIEWDTTHFNVTILPWNYTNSPPYLKEDVSGKYIVYENQELVVDYVPYDDNLQDKITTWFNLMPCADKMDEKLDEVQSLLKSTSALITFADQNYVRFNPSSAWVGLSGCATLTLFDTFEESVYEFEFEVRSEDEYVEEVVVEEVVASTNITVVLQEEVLDTFVPPVNKTVATVETFDFEEAFTSVEYLFSTGEPITSPADIAILRNAFPYPVPYITEIDSEGGIKVAFSRTLSLREAFKNTSKRDRLAFIEQDLIETRSFLLTLRSTPEDSDDSGEEGDQVLTTLGDVHFDEEKFVESDQKRNL